MDREQAERDNRSLYHALLESWNKKSGSEFAALFTEDGDVVGFDGSGHTGKSVIESDDGTFRAMEVLPGRYTLSFWTARGAADSRPCAQTAAIGSTTESGHPTSCVRIRTLATDETRIEHG